jgi:hypothetical protein
MNANEILDLIEQRKEELFRLLGSLIRFNSESFKSHGNGQKAHRVRIVSVRPFGDFQVWQQLRVCVWLRTGFQSKGWCASAE